MDIYQALANDHNQLRPLLDLLVSASQKDQKTNSILDQIRDHLIPHSRAEEAVFYNSLRGLEPTKDLVAHSYREHMEAEAILRMLRGLESISIEWTTAAKKLRSALNHHIDEEEGPVFSAARQVLFHEEAEQLAVAFDKMKAQYAAQSDLKNTLEIVANMMPTRFIEGLRGFDPTGI